MGPSSSRNSWMYNGVVRVAMTCEWWVWITKVRVFDFAGVHVRIIVGCSLIEALTRLYVRIEPTHIHIGHVEDAAASAKYWVTSEPESHSNIDHTPQRLCLASRLSGVRILSATMHNIVWLRIWWIHSVPFARQHVSQVSEWCSKQRSNPPRHRLTNRLWYTYPFRTYDMG